MFNMRKNQFVVYKYSFSGDALLCYACNSRYDPRCADPFNPYSLGIMNCSMIVPAVPDVKHNICRKMTQKSNKIHFNNKYIK